MTPQLNAALTTDTADEPVTAPQTIVLAIDGSSESDNAVACANRLAELSGGRIHVVSVAEPTPATLAFPPFLGDLSIPPVPPIDYETIAATQLKQVRDQLKRVTRSSSEWTVAMRSGPMGLEVADFARTLNGDVIVCGRGRHGIVDRLLGEEHLVRLLRATRIPVLAAESGLQLPAKRVVIAVDFSEHNHAVARAAVSFIADDAVVYLVHVKPDPPFGIPHPGQWIKSYEDGVRVGLQGFQQRLHLPATASIEPIVLNGHPGVALADFARASRSDLLVVGSHGAGFWNRLVIGSVTTYLLRTESCSLLVVPTR